MRGIDLETIEKESDGGLRHRHRVAVTGITYPETREFEYQATEMLGQFGKHSPIVPPPGHPGAGAVEQQQRWALACLMEPEHPEIGVQLPQTALVAHVCRHGPNVASPAPRPQPRSR